MADVARFDAMGCIAERSVLSLRLIAMTHMRRLGLFAFVPVMAAAACAGAVGAGAGGATVGVRPAGSSYASAPSGGALAVCRQELRGRDVVSGTWTTVGALRDWGHGGPVATQPLAHVFPTASAADQAAWCWTKDAPQTYTMWGARAQDGAQFAFKMSEAGSWNDPTPSGVIQPP